MYKIGSLLSINKELFILSKVSNRKVALISLMSGRRYRSLSAIDLSDDISPATMSKFCRLSELKPVSQSLGDYLLKHSNKIKIPSGDRAEGQIRDLVYMYLATRYPTDLFEVRNSTAGNHMYLIIETDNEDVDTNLYGSYHRLFDYRHLNSNAPRYRYIIPTNVANEVFG